MLSGGRFCGLRRLGTFPPAAAPGPSRPTPGRSRRACSSRDPPPLWTGDRAGGDDGEVLVPATVGEVRTRAGHHGRAGVDPTARRGRSRPPGTRAGPAAATSPRSAGPGAANATTIRAPRSTRSSWTYGPRPCVRESMWAAMSVEPKGSPSREPPRHQPAVRMSSGTSSRPSAVVETALTATSVPLGSRTWVGASATTPARRAGFAGDGRRRRCRGRAGRPGRGAGLAGHVEDVVVGRRVGAEPAQPPRGHSRSSHDRDERRDDASRRAASCPFACQRLGLTSGGRASERRHRVRRSRAPRSRCRSWPAPACRPRRAAPSERPGPSNRPPDRPPRRPSSPCGTSARRSADRGSGRWSRRSGTGRRRARPPGRQRWRTHRWRCWRRRPCRRPGRRPGRRSRCAPPGPAPCRARSARPASGTPSPRRPRPPTPAGAAPRPGGSLDATSMVAACSRPSRP